MSLLAGVIIDDSKKFGTLTFTVLGNYIGFHEQQLFLLSIWQTILTIKRRPCQMLLLGSLMTSRRSSGMSASVSGSFPIWDRNVPAEISNSNRSRHSRLVMDCWAFSQWTSFVCWTTAPSLVGPFGSDDFRGGALGVIDGSAAVFDLPKEDGLAFLPAENESLEVDWVGGGFPWNPNFKF